jgi:hypothetical protein
LRSSSNVKTAMPHRGHKIVILAAVQSLVILWLANWAIGDYLNNQYVRAYVDGTIQANQLMIFGVFALAIIGSIGGVWFKRRGRSSIELVNVQGSGKISTPVVSANMGGSSGATSTPSPAVSSGPSVELHPAVAALKAEMSERRVALGLNPGMMDQPQSPVNVQAPQNTPSSVASLLPPDIRALAQAPRPAIQAPSGPQMSAPMLQTVQPPAAPRGPIATLPVARPVQPGMPVLRQGPPDAPVPRPVQPNVPAARPNPPPNVIPQNVTTVITGIMPKKKDSDDPNAQKSSGQQA